MRIVLINKYGFVTGGADRNCIELAQALRKAGHEVAMLATQHPSNRETVGAFVPLAVTHATRSELSILQRVQVAFSAFWNRTAAGALEHLLRDFRPDLIHCHKLYPQLSVAPVVVAARHGIPIVQTAHDYEFASASALDPTGGLIDRQEGSLVYRMLNTGLFALKRTVHRRLVNQWIVASDFVGDRYRERNIAADVLPYFTHVYGASQFLERETRDGVLFFGRLVPEKGVADVLELSRRLPKTHVTIAGDGDLKGSVKAASSDQPSLHYLGRLCGDDLLRAIRRARVVLMPSLWQEPAGLAALEAMAAGTPVVAYANGGLGDYVRSSGGGVVTEPEVGALVAGCSRLLDDDAHWDRCSRQGREAIHRRHSVEGYVERITQVYELVAAGGPLPGSALTG